MPPEEYVTPILPVILDRMDDQSPPQPQNKACRLEHLIYARDVWIEYAAEEPIVPKCRADLVAAGRRFVEVGVAEKIDQLGVVIFIRADLPDVVGQLFVFHATISVLTAP